MDIKHDSTAGLYSQQYEAKSASAATDDLTNPYVGPRPFETVHKKLFFGRDLEADTLLSITIADRIVLFHAQSGAGKSSLVNAKVIPGLEERDYLVLPRARVGLGDGGKHSGVTNVFVFNALSSIAPGDIGIEALAQAQLSQYRAWLLPEQQDTSRWLIFDQFEEILTTHKDFWHQRDDFFRQVASALSQDSLLSVMFVMRSDYVAGIEPYAGLLPGSLRTRFYMELPKRAAAMEAVQKPVLEFECVFEKDAAEEVVNRLSLINAASGEREGEHVEPVLLQVVCQQLWNRISARTEGAIAKITLEDVKEYAQVDEALRYFYEDTVKEVASGQTSKEERIREWFGQCLIVPPGIRGQVMREDSLSGELETTLADEFVEKHIIRREETRGAVWYELAHDRLIRPIKDSNDVWLNLKENAYQRLALKWHKADYTDDLLLAAHELPAAQEWLQQNGKAASPRVMEFINISIEKETQRQNEQKLLEVKRANEALQQQGAELEAQREKVLEEYALLQTQAEQRRRKTYNILAAVAVLAVLLTGVAGYQAYWVKKLRGEQAKAQQVIKEGEEAEKVIEKAKKDKEAAIAAQLEAQFTSYTLEQRLQTLSIIYHINLESLKNLDQSGSVAKDEIAAIEEEHKDMVAAPEKRFPVGVPVTVADKGFTTLILGTDLIQLRQVPSRARGSDELQSTTSLQKIVFWRKGTPRWHAQYVAYVLMRAGVQVKMIRECSTGPMELADINAPVRDYNLCLWNGQDWGNMSVVVGWHSKVPLKENCALTIDNIKKNSWRACFDEKNNPSTLEKDRAREGAVRAPANQWMPWWEDKTK